MKITVAVVLIILLFTGKIYAQRISHKYDILKVPETDLKHVTDSLKLKLLSDTIYFNKMNLVHSSIGTMNENPYSPLIIINKRFNFKLDIVSGILVKQFVDNMLKADNIKAIYILNEQMGFATYGEFGKKGIIFLELKRIQKGNFEIAGFKMSKDKSSGNNYEQ